MLEPVFNRSAGTMLVKFSPDQDDAFDSKTISLIGDFIASPQNTANAKILVEIPKLSDDEVTVMINAITDAFKEHGVKQSDLSFAFVDKSVSGKDGIFDINLSFLLTKEIERK